LITAVIHMIITYIVAWIIIPENPNKFIEIEIEKD
jgi:phage shock protein PspC (stress-responsive transcriptional regulator)